MTTTTAEVTAEFMVLFNKLHDEGEDEGEGEDEEPKKKKAKTTTSAAAAAAPAASAAAAAAVLGPDDAVAISLAAAEYYLNQKAEWGPCELIEGFADFSRLIYAKAKEFKAKYPSSSSDNDNDNNADLFDAAAIAKAIREQAAML